MPVTQSKLAQGAPSPKAGCHNYFVPSLPGTKQYSIMTMPHMIHDIARAYALLSNSTRACTGTQYSH